MCAHVASLILIVCCSQISREESIAPSSRLWTHNPDDLTPFCIPQTNFEVAPESYDMPGRERKGYKYPGQGVANVEGGANVEDDEVNEEVEPNVEGDEANVEGGEVNVEGEETIDVGSVNEDVLSSSAQEINFSSDSLDTSIPEDDFCIDDSGFELEYIEENSQEIENDQNCFSIDEEEPNTDSDNIPYAGSEEGSFPNISTPHNESDIYRARKLSPRIKKILVKK